jgi:hypothetical protein
MDISTINDLNQLKAIAYDTMLALEQQQTNLRLIKQRIAEVEQEQAEPKKK